MALRLVQVNIKAADDQLVGRFWSDLLGWELTSEGPGVANVEPPDESLLGIDVVAVPDPSSVDYRTHLELARRPALVARLAELGAAAVGDDGAHGDNWADGNDWVDPEGNLFRLVDAEDSTGPIASVVVECADPRALAEFWDAASDWAVTEQTDDRVRLRSSTTVGPFLEFRRELNPRPTRMHIDLRPYPGDDKPGEVARLGGLGARETDIGQGDAPWSVLVDPAGNEFCVLAAG